MRKGPKSLAELHYLDAPHAATGAFLGDIDADARGAPLGWWNTRDDARPAISGAYVGLEASVDRVKRCVADDGPFDGVLGFSQGATLAALLCLAEPDLFRFAVCFAGFLPRDATVRAPFDAATAAPNPTPTFHCFGDSDASVPIFFTWRPGRHETSALRHGFEVSRSLNLKRRLMNIARRRAM